MYQKIVSVPTTGITVEYDELFEAVTLEVLGTGEITAQYLPAYSGDVQTPASNTTSSAPIQLLDQPHRGLRLSADSGTIPCRITAWRAVGAK